MCAKSGWWGSEEGYSLLMSIVQSSIKQDYFIFSYIYLCGGMCTYIKSEQGVACGAGVTGGCEPPGVSVRS